MNETAEILRFFAIVGMIVTDFSENLRLLQFQQPRIDGNDNGAERHQYCADGGA